MQYLICIKIGIQICQNLHIEINLGIKISIQKNFPSRVNTKFTQGTIQKLFQNHSAQRERSRTLKKNKKRVKNFEFERARTEWPCETDNVLMDVYSTTLLGRNSGNGNPYRYNRCFFYIPSALLLRHGYSISQIEWKKKICWHSLIIFSPFSPKKIRKNVIGLNLMMPWVSRFLESNFL